MKIVKNNPNQLVLRSDPYMQMIFDLVFLLAGLAITFLMARSVDVACQHAGSQTINCQLSDKLLGAIPVGQRTVTGIQGAEIQENHNSKNNSTTYQVVFVTGSGRVSLTGYSDGSGGKAQTAEQINNFIRSGQDTLNFQLPMNGLVLIFLFVFGGVGLGIMLLAQSVEVEMSRSDEKSHIRKDGLFGSGQEAYALSEIQGVYLQSHLNHHHGHHAHTTV